MDGNNPDVTEAVAQEPLPSTVCNTITISLRTNGEMNVATDPPLDRFQLIGLFSTLLKSL